MSVCQVMSVIYPLCVILFLKYKYSKLCLIFFENNQLIVNI